MIPRFLSVQLLQLLVIFFTSGCSPGGSTVDPPRDRLFQTQTLHIDCGEEIDRTLVAEFAREWGREQGVRVDIQHSQAPGDADVVIVLMADLPRFVETGAYLPVLPSMLSRESSLQWENLTPLYSGLFARWNGVTYGIPLLGEGDLMVYRKDRLNKNGLAPPATWEDFAEAAKSLGKNSLPPLAGRRTAAGNSVPSDRCLLRSPSPSTK